MTIFKKAKMAKANMAKMVRDSMERVRTPEVLFLCLLERRDWLEGTSCEFLCFSNKMVHSFISWIAYINVYNICHLVTMATVPSQANESVGACLVCRSDPQRPFL